MKKRLFTWANWSVHGLGRWYTKFRTRKFRPGIAFITKKNGREGLSPVSKMALTNGTRNSVWNIPSGKTGLPFQTFHCYRKFLVERPKKSCAIYFPNGFSGKFW